MTRHALVSIHEKNHHKSMMWMSWIDTADDKGKEKKKEKEQYVGLILQKKTITNG